MQADLIIKDPPPPWVGGAGGIAPLSRTPLNYVGG